MEADVRFSLRVLPGDFLELWATLAGPGLAHDPSLVTRGSLSRLAFPSPFILSQVGFSTRHADACAQECGCFRSLFTASARFRSRSCSSRIAGLITPSRWMEILSPDGLQFVEPENSPPQHAAQSDIIASGADPLDLV